VNQEAIILFDGVCNLCNGAVNFIIDHDPQMNFKFAAIQSKTGSRLMQELKISTSNLTPESIILIEQNRFYTHSTAVLKIALQLKGFWKLTYSFILVPKFLRDWAYRLIAKNRYRWFGKQESCRIPTPELTERFILN